MQLGHLLCREINMSFLILTRVSIMSFITKVNYIRVSGDLLRLKYMTNLKMQLSENAQGQWAGLCRYDLYRIN